MARDWTFRILTPEQCAILDDRCDSPRGGPRSKIRCEIPNAHHEYDVNRDWHSGRGCDGRWFSWRREPTATEGGPS